MESLFSILFWLAVILFFNRRRIREALPRWRENLRNIFSGSKEKRMNNGDVYQEQPREPRKHSPTGQGIVKLIAGILIAVAVMAIGAGAFYNVGEQEQAVLTMFGRIVRTDTAGLYFSGCTRSI